MGTDIARCRLAAGRLYRAFASEGIHGHQDMPEDLLPAGVARRSLEQILFITLTVSIDYQRDAPSLWESSRKTMADPETRYLFSPGRLHESGLAKVRNDMLRHGLAKKPCKDAYIWHTVGVTFLKKYGGDPRNLLLACSWDAVKVLRALRDGRHTQRNREVLDFPYLRDPKIGPLWLRMLRDNVGMTELRSMEEVPLPVDVHVARATLCLGIVRGTFSGPVQKIYQLIRRAWHEGVKGLEAAGRPMIALDLDEALWHLSKYGCTRRDPESGHCPVARTCPVRDLCWPGAIKLTGPKLELREVPCASVR